MTVDGHTLWFSYDAQGPMFVKYDSSTYQYLTNLQGDVTALANSEGDIVVEYTYDAWGNILSTTGTLASTLGKYNPLRYRGYVYDIETGLYYVSSRYYDPEIGRFINADSLVSTGQGLLGNNMFAYCRNNPVCRKDITGTEDTVAYDDGELLSDDDLDERATGGGGGKITLYRAVSPAESNSATTTQRFSPGSNSYEGSKYFATSQADAQKWGDAMYKDGNYEVISGTFYSEVTAGSGVIFYPRLDGIGPADLIPISALNESVIMISCVW